MADNIKRVKLFKIRTVKQITPYPLKFKKKKKKKNVVSFARK